MRTARSVPGTYSSGDFVCDCKFNRNGGKNKQVVGSSGSVTSVNSDPGGFHYSPRNRETRYFQENEGRIGTNEGRVTSVQRPRTFNVDSNYNSPRGEGTTRKGFADRDYNNNGGSVFEGGSQRSSTGNTDTKANTRGIFGMGDESTRNLNFDFSRRGENNGFSSGTGNLGGGLMFNAHEEGDAETSNGRARNTGFGVDMSTMEQDMHRGGGVNIGGQFDFDRVGSSGMPNRGNREWMGGTGMSRHVTGRSSSVSQNDQSRRIPNKFGINTGSSNRDTTGANSGESGGGGIEVASSGFGGNRFIGDLEASLRNSGQSQFGTFGRSETEGSFGSSIGKGMAGSIGSSFGGSEIDIPGSSVNGFGSSLAGSVGNDMMGVAGSSTSSGISVPFSGTSLGSSKSIGGFTTGSITGRSGYGLGAPFGGSSGSQGGGVILASSGISNSGTSFGYSEHIGGLGSLAEGVRSDSLGLGMPGVPFSGSSGVSSGTGDLRNVGTDLEHSQVTGGLAKGLGSLSEAGGFVSQGIGSGLGGLTSGMMINASHSSGSLIGNVGLSTGVSDGATKATEAQVNADPKKEVENVNTDGASSSGTFV